MAVSNTSSSSLHLKHGAGSLGKISLRILFRIYQDLLGNTGYSYQRYSWRK